MQKQGESSGERASIAHSPACVLTPDIGTGPTIVRGETPQGLLQTPTHSLYFNDTEPFVAPWLSGLWPDGVVDTRSISLIRPAQVKGFDRVHLFAGIGGWEYALGLAGWPSDMPVWTGSCPCQPFSTAGKGKGEADARHLWPEMLWLIAECRPPVVFGEQVASNLGRQWLSRVRADLEALGYGVGAADLCAAGVAAPHLRQRLYWVAHTERHGLDGAGKAGPRGGHEPPDSSNTGPDGLADAPDSRRRQERALSRGSDERSGSEGRATGLGSSSTASGLGDTVDARLERYAWYVADGGEPGRFPANAARPAWAAGWLGPWGDFDLLPCVDGKTRRIESGTFPLAHGVPGRVGRIRAYGNSIVPQVAATWIRAFMEAVGLAEV